VDTRWTLDFIQQLIANQVEESLTLEYKAANALVRDSKSRDEITKDVSAMANSAGGVIIYGLQENRNGDLRLPERIDVIDQTALSKEWLEQVISNVRPRIQELKIYSLQVHPGRGIYVVEIPQSTTAHQAADKRYYKRYNFQSVAMEDHEVRDVMGRQQHPKIVLEFKVNKFRRSDRRKLPDGSLIERVDYKLIVTAVNEGTIYATYVNCFMDVPLIWYPHPMQEVVSRYQKTKVKDGVEYLEWSQNNTIRDVIRSTLGVGVLAGEDELGPARYDPILPGLTHSWEIELNENFETEVPLDSKINWVAYADNARPIRGVINREDIEICSA